MATSFRLAQRLAAAAAVLALCGAVFTPISAAPAMPTLSTREEQFLQAHNKARATAGVSHLTWSRELAEYAKKLAADQQRAGRASASCDFSKQAELSSYGANQAVGNFMVSPEMIVRSWMDGRRYYNSGDHSCAAGHDRECSDYTQLVSTKTKRLGCGSAGCGKDGSLTICLYDPRGNIYGQSPH
ncbi:hypothetical protein KSP39_PZI023356 [Platanthera zijinensis]|uniref:SCP domain-containing protein n=1 Tax=Platanthera zijinensis TaxID=2320716 RepID=A0AAP0FUJ6_9ASPA